MILEVLTLNLQFCFISSVFFTVKAVKCMLLWSCICVNFFFVFTFRVHASDHSSCNPEGHKSMN